MKQRWKNKLPNKSEKKLSQLSYFARYYQLFITSHSGVSCKGVASRQLGFSVMFLHKSAHLANCEIILQISKIFKFRKLGFFCIAPRIGEFGNSWDFFANIENLQICRACIFFIFLHKLIDLAIFGTTLQISKNKISFFLHKFNIIIN